MPVMLPPVIATLLAFCVDIVPRPVMSVLGIVELAVSGVVPAPLTYPVNEDVPVPPSATARSVMPVMLPPVIATLFAF